MHPLYRDTILEHNRAPRGQGVVERPTHAAEWRNARCGDVLRWVLRAPDGRIEAAAFSSEACAIAVATASMLSERLPGLDAAAVEALRAQLECRLHGEDGEALGALDVLAELAHHPARRDCARLAFDALRAAFANPLEPAP